MCPWLVECTAVPLGLGTSILCNAHSDEFVSSIGLGYVAMLRIVFQPTPLVGIVGIGAIHIVGLSGAESKELSDGSVLIAIGQIVGIGHDDRLTLPVEPKIFI